MPRLSLWKDGKHTNDYRFFDRRISEMFTVGGTGVLLHKYLGANDQNVTKTTAVNQSTPSATLPFLGAADVTVGMFVVGLGIPDGATIVSKTATTVTLSASTTVALTAGSTVKFYDDATQPSYINQSAQNIQDLFFLENRDRKYDTSIYTTRGIYQVSDTTFDLSQFGLFLQTGTLFMVFHINDMIETIGRKIMPGDVLELQHLKDYFPLDTSLPVALKRYYVVGDCQNAAEGYSATWFPHLWRCKLNPMTDSQEYKDILNQIADEESGSSATVGQVSSIIGKYQQINDAILSEAERNVPYSGYDISSFYIKPQTQDHMPGDPLGVTSDDVTVSADSSVLSADAAVLSPDNTIHGYLTGDGLTPNGLPVTTGIAFPPSPTIGDYALRTDYLPNRLFRYDGRRWVKIEDDVRTTSTPGPDNQTQRSGFVNNTDTFTNNSGTHNERQSLSQALRPKADN